MSDSELLALMEMDPEAAYRMLKAMPNQDIPGVMRAMEALATGLVSRAAYLSWRLMGNGDTRASEESLAAGRAIREALGYTMP